ncbi:polysaccharide biosynthesis tyrosine autokinase [Noviherbaspirillum aridicola]|uniref:Tyrosine-protein kinase involved in EPS biosynthesis n=1 Tax=Noviherbaspirillum aridicola TaxID=2849687 RepID=A0ABQ4Q9R3_9BURK|nr:polysaccharide biosynthesis tyrosine autokinase [Noviherbaspirillum aridicola]GIZ53952.1 tyrosine-protein kinase involved in EPS biosynthesis [Noviherbaspirillum aridicola]
MMNHPIPPQLTGPVPVYRPEEKKEAELGTYLDVLWESRWLIATIAVVVTLLGAVYAFTAKSVYQASMLIHVEEEGQQRSQNIVGDLQSMFDVKTSALAEMELVQSRLVVSRATDNLRLYINAGPKYFPVIGRWIADRNQKLSNPGVLGYGGFAWGAERIDAAVFNVPDALLNREFVVIAEGNGGYRLTQKEQGIDLRAKVGETAIFELPKGTIEVRVDRLDAKPGAEFLMSRASRLATIEGIQSGLKVQELGGKQSGVIGVSLQGSNPAFVHTVLNEIGKEYVKQNAARQTEDAEKSLAYLNKQLPEIKTQLEQAEAKYNAFRNANGTVDLGEESKLSLQQSSAAKLRKLELQQKKIELLARYTDDHPAVQGIDMQLREINGQINAMNDHIKQLPQIEQNLLRLQREVKVNTDLYTQLLNTAQQMRLITVGKVSNVRLVDPPMVPEKPVKPNRPVILALALMAGLFFGVVAAFFRKSLTGSIDTPEQLEQIAGVPVYATIPHSKKQRELYQQVNAKHQKVPLLANVSSGDVAVESLRNFRTALQYAMPSFKNNIVLISGATPGMGKSFVSANLAAIMAATGKRVLLIDGDLRNGLLHLYFGFGRHDGLSDAIAGARRLDQVIHHDVIENLDFITTGTLPQHPSELLLRPNFGAFLQELSARYDLVLVDAPPILAVADTMIIGAHVGAIYIMTRAGVTTPGEINESMKRLAQAGLEAKGVLFNDLKVRPGRYGYGYGYTYGGRSYNQRPAGNTPLIEAS